MGITNKNCHNKKITPIKIWGLVKKSIKIDYVYL